MDIRNYENPFASSEEEIGREDVPINRKDLTMETLRRTIRALIIENMQSHTDEPEVGSRVRNTNVGCDHYGSMGEVIALMT